MPLLFSERKEKSVIVSFKIWEIVFIILIVPWRLGIKMKAPNMGMEEHNYKLYNYDILPTSHLLPLHLASKRRAKFPISNLNSKFFLPRHSLSLFPLFFISRPNTYYYNQLIPHPTQKCFLGNSIYLFHYIVPKSLFSIPLNFVVVKNLHY